MREPVARDPRPGLSALDRPALEAWLAEVGQPPFRARQLLDAVWNGAARTPEAVTTLPRALVTSLGDAYRWSTVTDDEIVLADGGETEKALHRLSDGSTVESVLMHYPARGDRRSRHTLCISSQAGCAVGCPFCATGELGFTRDLETAEILDQVRSALVR
ncbi:MAG TPA: hypothetical protein VJ850_03620, partial [Candidatus Limnocylindrales bacterium]|nr:hypothetical protein [Candidatus Limnocylindrales bacterium]